MTKISTKQKSFILIFSTIVYAAIFLTAAISLFDRPYASKELHIFKLDSIKILSRAYYLTSSKSSSQFGLEFQDLTFKTFQLERLNLNDDEEFKTLFDTLQFNKTIVTIYTDKEGFRNYRDQNDDNKISALNISIADKSFGSLDSINTNAKRKLNFVLMWSTFAYGLFLLIYFNLIRT